jgi:hypothetical protein
MIAQNLLMTVIYNSQDFVIRVDKLDAPRTAQYADVWEQKHMVVKGHEPDSCEKLDHIPAGGEVRYSGIVVRDKSRQQAHAVPPKFR